MPLRFIQGNSAIAGVAHFPGAASFPCPFTSNNGQGNLLFAFISAKTGTRPSSVTDTAGNNWQEIAQPNNVGDNFSLYCVQSCKPGPNTVSANGMTVTVAGGPNICIAEFALPVCTPCGIGITGFNPPRSNSGFAAPFLKAFCVYNQTEGPFFQTIIFGLYDNADGGANVARTWASTSTLIVQETRVVAESAEDGGNNTSCLAYSTVPYPYTYNECQLAPTPTSPALYGDETYPLWALVNTLA